MVPRPVISVLTLTRGRPDVLRRRAMASVFAQDFPGAIEHVVIVDDDPDSVDAVVGAPVRPGLTVVPHLVRRPASDADSSGGRRDSYPRLSRLLNAGARISTGEWIAVLDDDNEFEPDHLSSLHAAAGAAGVRVAHSGRQLLNADGTPYLDERWHTVADPVEATRIFELMCDRGIRVRGTNVLLDRADPHPTITFRPSSVIRAGDPVLTVDQNVWLYRREVMLEMPWPEDFSEQDHQDNGAPDDKFLQVLLENREPMVRTDRPTVRYYLGGMSNKYRPEPAS
jgi:hypothetical protein